jgi:hypothetical protein
MEPEIREALSKTLLFIRFIRDHGTDLQHEACKTLLKTVTRIEHRELYNLLRDLGVDTI